MTDETDGRQAIPQNDPTTADYAVASQGAAVLSNRFYVTLSQSGARIAFCEAFPGVAEQFRTAVVLNYNDAIELADILKSLISANVIFSGTETPKAEAR